VPDDREPEELVADLLERLANRDRKSLTAIRSAARSLGVALSGVVNLLDLPIVVLGGTYARLAPWLWEPLRAELTQRVVSSEWSPIEIIASTLGSEAAVHGAAGSAVRAILADPDPYITAALA
jgi:predicted NBD/HSP70 family sugar kinase